MFCMQSLFLESLAGQQQQAAEVALAQAAAREAVGERGQLEQMLTWLTGAHAEEAALHRTFKAEVPTELSVACTEAKGSQNISTVHPFSCTFTCQCSRDLQIAQSTPVL